MSISIENYTRLIEFYNQLGTVLSAICVYKGGIATENYVGRFFDADVLEYVVEYGKRLKETGQQIEKTIIDKMDLYEQKFELVKDLVTPNQKPFYEMSLEEFEKYMNL